MPFTLPDARYGVKASEYDTDALGIIPQIEPNFDLLNAANELAQHRYQNLTARQRVFVDAYLGADFDATKAALAAGYPANEAASVGRKTIQKREIRQAIQYALHYFSEKNKLRFEKIVDEIKVIAFSNIGDFYKNDGHGNPYLEMPLDNDPRLRAISEITIESYEQGRGEHKREVVRTRFKFHNKLDALEKLIKVYAPNLSADRDKQGGVAVSVQNVNVVSVPNGRFVDAPTSPYASDTVIEHSQIDRVADQAMPGSQS